MPFQSEKQRRYLWANEPEIARDWTNTYGSRVKKANGGLGALYEGWEGLGNPFPTAVSQFGNYLTGGEDVTNLADIAPTGPYQDVIQEGILGALNRQSGLNQGDFSRLVKADDYGGHKIGESFKSADTPIQFASMLPEGLPRELLEMVKVGIGDPTSNVANTLGDFQFEYKPPATDFDDDYMGISDRYNFPTSNFFPGNKFNMSGELTNADQKREIRDAIFDLQSKQRISNLAKGDPSVMQPHDFEFGDEWVTADEDNEESNWFKNMLSFAPFFGKNSRTGAALRMFGNNFMNEGIGSIPNKLRGGLTQQGYEQAKQERIKQKRIDYMLNRRAQGKDWGEKNLNVLTMGSRPGFYGNQPTYKVKAKQPKPKAPHTYREGPHGAPASRPDRSGSPGGGYTNPGQGSYGPWS